MYGKCVPIEKPLVVMKKTRGFMQPTHQPDEEDEEMETDFNPLDQTLANRCTEYLIKAVIRKKYIFNKRPRPIVVYEPKKL